jgi:hypothetical protein
MRTVTTTVGPLAAASANNICLSQTPTVASGFTINGTLANGGVATLDTPRRVLFTPAGNESLNTFTITGTNWSGQPISETLTGTNATAFYSVLDYATVTKISLTVNAAGAITVGTNGVASSPWVRLDQWALPQVTVQADVTGAVNYTLQQTLDDPNDPTNPVAAALVNWVNTSDSNGVNATTTIMSSYAYAPVWARVLLNSGSGSVAARYSQLGVAPY